MPTLSSGDLVLEPIAVAHAEEMFPLLSDPEVYRFLDHGPPPSLAHLQKVYETLARGAPPESAERWFNWVVRHKRLGVLGYVQATVVEPSTAWVAYVLGVSSWGQGHGSAATEAMMAYLASALRISTFLATVELENHRSVALLRKLSFRPASAEEAEPHALSPTEGLYVCRSCLPIG